MAAVISETQKKVVFLLKIYASLLHFRQPIVCIGPGRFVRASSCEDLCCTLGEDSRKPGTQLAINNMIVKHSYL